MVRAVEAFVVWVSTYNGYSAVAVAKRMSRGLYAWMKIDSVQSVWIVVALAALLQ